MTTVVRSAKQPITIISYNLIGKYTMTKDIDKIITSIIKDHKEGENFYDLIDHRIRNEGEDWFVDLLQLAEKTNDRHINNIVVSGLFGRLFVNEWAKGSLNVILVEGGLRHSYMMSLEPFKDQIVGREFIFLDDSLYLGRTRDKIKAEIEFHGGDLLNTFVVFDGGKIIDDTVYSLYRKESHIDNIKPKALINEYIMEGWQWNKASIHDVQKTYTLHTKHGNGNYRQRNIEVSFNYGWKNTAYYYCEPCALYFLKMSFNGETYIATPIIESEKQMKTISQFYTLVKNKLNLKRYPKSKVKSTGLALIDKKWYLGVMYDPKGEKKVTWIPYLCGIKVDLDETTTINKELTYNDEEKRTLFTIGQQWSFDEFKHARQPIVIDKVYDRYAFQNPMPNVVDLPIKMAGDNTMYLPTEYEGMTEALSKIIGYEKSVNPNYDEYYAYLTIDKRVVREGSSQSRIGYHVDGFQSAEQTYTEVRRNYAVFDIVPTEFVVTPMETRGLMGTVGEVYESFTHQSQHAEVIKAKPFEINHFDAYQVHTSAVALATTDRTYLRLSFAKRQLNRLGNGINPLIDYDWTYVPKDTISEVTV